MTIGATEVGESCVFDTLFERADAALYEAERRGLNCVHATPAPAPAPVPRRARV